MVTTSMSHAPQRVIPKVWKRTCTPCYRPSLQDTLSSPTLRPQEGWLGLTLGTPWSCPAPWGCWRHPKSSPMLQPGLLCLGAQLCSGSATWWEAVPFTARVPKQGLCSSQGTPQLPLASSRGKRDPPAQQTLTILIAGDRDVVDGA